MKKELNMKSMGALALTNMKSTSDKSAYTVEGTHRIGVAEFGEQDPDQDELVDMDLHPTECTECRDDTSRKGMHVDEL